MSRSNTRIQKLTRVTALKDGDIIPIGPASGDRAKGITNKDFQSQFSNIVNISSVNSGYTLQDSDSADFIVFNNAGNAILNIPDGIGTGVNFAYTNIGAGSVQVVLTGTDTLRGAAILTDPDGYGAAVKLTANIWQLSER